MKDFANPIYLQATPTLDYNHPAVKTFIAKNTKPTDTKQQQAIQLHNAIRDDIRYDPFTFSLKPEDYKASTTVLSDKNWCIPKSVLYAACCRGIGIPTKLGFADVKNHLSTNVLRLLLESDVFYWHGYVSLYLNERWVKATPVFDAALCEKYKLCPLDFNGLVDSLYHPFDQEGNQHMEYINDRGTYPDLPLQEMIKGMFELYPSFMTRIDVEDIPSFEEQVLAETTE